MSLARRVITSSRLGMSEQLVMPLKKLSPRGALEVLAAIVLHFLCPRRLKLASESWSLSSFSTVSPPRSTVGVSRDSLVRATSESWSSKSNPSFEVLPLLFFLDLEGHVLHSAEKTNICSEVTYCHLRPPILIFLSHELIKM